MLHKPTLAFCNNRAPALTHPCSGEPDEWLADTYLEPHGLVGLTFDFFVNWRTRSVSKNSRELWIKRIVEPSFEPWPIERWRDIPSKISQCDGGEKVKQLCEFADKYGMSCHYFLFKESRDWENSPSPIIEVKLDENGSVVGATKVDLHKLMDRIQQLSGGHVPVGKGLTLGLSTLECYLANDKKDAGAAWPGDADLFLVDSNFTPHATIEFKKHTPRDKTSFVDQKLSNHYRRGDNWSRDGRKYNRLAIFRDYLSGNAPPLPIIVVYFPVQESIEQVQLERVEGTDRELRTEKSEFVPLPNVKNEESCRDFVASLLEMIES